MSFYLYLQEHLKEFEADLVMFSVTRIKIRCIDSLPKENSELVSYIDNLEPEIEKLGTIATETQSVPESKVIRFSQTRKHPELRVSDDRKRVVNIGGGWDLARTSTTSR
ncbi:hypothetical protein GEMRC1_004216 [Eukaryota sp. GEM-RC1]